MENSTIGNMVITKLESGNVRFIALDQNDQVVFYFESSAEKARMLAAAIYDLTPELSQ